MRGIKEGIKAVVGTTMATLLEAAGFDQATITFLVAWASTHLLPFHEDNLANVIVNAQQHFRSDRRIDGSRDPLRLHGILEGASRASTTPEQDLWARLLAGELEVPGSASKRLISTLSGMDRNEAVAFTEIAPFVYLEGFVPRFEDVDIFPGMGKRIQAHEAGLLTNPQANPKAGHVIFLRDREEKFSLPPLLLEVIKVPSGQTYRVQGEELTRVGKMLYNMISNSFFVSADGACEIALQLRRWTRSTFMNDNSVLFDPSMVFHSDTNARQYWQAQLASRGERKPRGDV